VQGMVIEILNKVPLTLLQLYDGLHTHEVMQQRRIIDSYCRVKRIEEEITLLLGEVQNVHNHVRKDIRRLVDCYQVEDRHQYRCLIRRKIEELKSISSFHVDEGAVPADADLRSNSDDENFSDDEELSVQPEQDADSDSRNQFHIDSALIVTKKTTVFHMQTHNSIQSSSNCKLNISCGSHHSMLQ
jgi:hypothetical protein